MPGKLIKELESKRARVEDGQAELYFVQMNLDEINLRIRLAIQRSAGVCDVLMPALDRMSEVSASVEAVRHEMSTIWLDGQARRWEDNQQQLNSQTSHIHGSGMGGDELRRKGSRRVA